MEEEVQYTITDKGIAYLMFSDENPDATYEEFEEYYEKLQKRKEVNGYAD